MLIFQLFLSSLSLVSESSISHSIWKIQVTLMFNLVVNGTPFILIENPIRICYLHAFVSHASLP